MNNTQKSVSNLLAINAYDDDDTESQLAVLTFTIMSTNH